MAETYVAIMLQSLKKKEQVLLQIIILNRKQKDVLENPNATPDEFDDLVEQKSALIEQLDQLDSGFEKLFARMKEELEGNKDKYASQIKEMQTYIRSVTDKSVEIQSQESRNKDLMVKKFAYVRQQARTVRTGTQVASKYYQNMTKTGVIEPQFMDNKQ
jgi:flagellar biosynthesis/type III secretory pathway chaperone